MYHDKTRNKLVTDPPPTQKRTEGIEQKQNATHSTQKALTQSRDIIICV